MYTENGKFCTYPNFDHGICLSISHHHPESWNPVWKVNQIVIGLISFWLQSEHTWGDTQYDYKWPENSLTKNEQILAFAKDSIEHVKSHEKFHIFQDYADYIGINTREELKEWDEVILKRDTFVAAKAIKDAEAKKQRDIQNAEKERVKKIEKEKLEAEAKNKLIQEYFKLIHKKNVAKYIGQPKKLKALKVQAC